MGIGPSAMGTVIAMVEVTAMMVMMMVGNDRVHCRQSWHLEWVLNSAYKGKDIQGQYLRKVSHWVPNFVLRRLITGI